MAGSPNVRKGSGLVLLVKKDDDTVWEIVGGVTENKVAVSNPVEDTTNSTTPAGWEESEYTGHSQITLSISGMSDTRTNVTDPATGLNIVGYSRIASLATTGDRNGHFKLLNVANGAFYEGWFNITSFNTSGPVKGVQKFDATLQGKEGVTISGTV